MLNKVKLLTAVVVFMLGGLFMPTSDAYAAGWSQVASMSTLEGKLVVAPNGTMYGVVKYKPEDSSFYRHFVVTISSGGSVSSYSLVESMSPRELRVTVDKSGQAWVLVGGYGGDRTQLYKGSGTNFTLLKDFGASQSGGYYLLTGPDGIWLTWQGTYYVTTDGVNFTNRGTVQGLPFVGPDGYIWEGRGSGIFYRYRNGSWELVNSVADPTGNSTVEYLSCGGGIWRISRTGYPTFYYVSFWDGQNWVIQNSRVPRDSNGAAMFTIAPDGSLWAAVTGGSIGWGLVYRFNGSSWDLMGSGSDYWSPVAIGTGKDGVYVAGQNHPRDGWCVLRKYSPIPFPSTPTIISAGQTQITVNLNSACTANLLISLEGTNYTLPFYGSYSSTVTVGSLQPGTQYWIKTYWIDSITGLTLGGGTASTITVPATPDNITYTTSRVSWSNSVGRGKVVLSWPSVKGATGYAVWVFDGNAYRRFDVGSATTWDSQAARIYPDPNWLATQPDNSISTDPFNHAGGGFDLQDNPNILYRKTTGTTYDGATNYWFRVSAYNSSGESPMSSAVIVTLPMATDQESPTGSVSPVSREGLKKTFNPEIKVTVNVSDTLSGIRRIELSNDGVSYTKVYEAPLNPDNGTSVANYTNTFDWIVPLGAGTKVVYVRLTDAVGNTYRVTDSIALAEDMLPPSVTLQINGGAETTTSPNVTLTLSVQDNASTTSQMQMRFSNDGNLWSPWEPFVQTKAWDITASAYGGNTSPGMKKVYAQVCDQAQNVALAVAEIGYNPNPPVGAVTIVGGSSGMWNGKPALFTFSDAPTLNLNFPGATYVRFDPGTGIWGDWEPYDAVKTVYLVKSSGVARLRLQVKDTYGVTSSPQEFLVVVDPMPPVIQYLRGLNGATATTSSTITLEISVTDNLPGQLQYQYQVNRGSWSSWAILSGNTINVSGLASGANRITVSVKDQAGNVSSASITVFRI